MRRPSGNGAVRSDSWSTSPPDAGFTPQYGQLEELQHRYGDRGFTVLGFPSNQFPQEFGSSDKIAKYCSTTWGVTFPMMSKVKVDGKQQHPLHTELTTVPDAEGRAGKVRWNFEKFLVLPDGTVRRFRATTLPTAPEIVDSIETALPGGRN